MALTEEEVRRIFSEQFAVAKDFVRAGDGHIHPTAKGPEFWPGYMASCRQRRELAPHIINGEFPEHIFRVRAPNQTEAEINWLRENFKQVTLPVFLDLENTVGRGLHPGNWSLDFEEDSEDVKEYVTKDINEWGSVYNFIRFAGIRLKMQDAMGLLVVSPSEVPVVETTNEDGTTTTSVDPDGTIAPDIHYFPVDQLWGFKYDKYYLVRLNTNSDVMHGNRSQNTGIVCWLIDDTNVWRIQQIGKANEWQFDIGVEFPHGIGFPPCINWMGTPAVKDGSMVWESPYLAVKDILDIALTDEHYLRASKAKCAYPITVLIGDPCKFKDEKAGVVCVDGMLDYTDADGNYAPVPCRSCHGTGRTGRLSPFGEVHLNPDSNSSRPDTMNATNAVAFVSPSTETLAFMRNEFDVNMRLARSILHLDSEAPMAGGEAKTATEVGLGSRSRDAFVRTIADQMFVITTFVVECMGKIIKGSEWDGFTLRPPTSYDLRTDADRKAEIKTAMDDGLPPFVVQYAVWEYLLSRYGNNPSTIEMFGVITRADRLQGMSRDVILAETAAQRVQPWETDLHYNGLSMYEKLSADPSFIALDVDGKIDRLKAFAQENSTASPASPAMGRLASLVRA